MCSKSKRKMEKKSVQQSWIDSGGGFPRNATESKIAKAINQYCQDTGTIPECLDPHEVKTISSNYNLPTKKVFQFWNYWFSE